MIALEKRVFDIAEELLNAGARIDLQDKKGRTALHIAIEQRHIQLGLHLIRKGAPLNTQNNDGNTPLMLAAKNDLLPVVGALLGAGADPGQTTQGQTYHHFLSELINSIRAKSKKAKDQE